MKTIIAALDENNIDEKIIKEAGHILAKGGLVVFPTETVYGLGANALDGKAVNKIFQAKGRPQDNPLIIHVADYDISRFAKEIPDIALKLTEKFWPGPLTVVLKKSDIIPDETSASLDTVGIRMPSNPIAISLIRSAGVPVAAPSANISGRPSPTEMSRCVEDLDGKVDYIIGGDRSKVGLESTVVDCTVDPPCILRPGGVTLEMLREIDSRIYIDPAVISAPDKNLKPKAPGMKYRHYAPKAPVKIVLGQTEKTVEKINEMIQNYVKDNKIVGVMATDETLDMYSDCIAVTLGSRKDLNSVANSLFEALRALDDKGVDIIISEGFEEKGIGIAIMNRLKKSASFDMVEV